MTAAAAGGYSHASHLGFSLHFICYVLSKVSPVFMKFNKFFAIDDWLTKTFKKSFDIAWLTN